MEGFAGPYESGSVDVGSAVVFAALLTLDYWLGQYAQCANYPQLRQALQARQTLVAPMSQAELRVAVLYPAAAVGLDIEAGLVELLLRDSGTTPGNGDRADGTASQYDACEQGARRHDPMQPEAPWR